MPAVSTTSRTRRCISRRAHATPPSRRTWLDRQRYRPQQWSSQRHFGHTLGHAGVAVRVDGRWLFDAGDAYFYHAEVDIERPNQRRLRGLARDRGAAVDIFCSHDMTKLERLAGVSSELRTTYAPAR